NSWRYYKPDGTTGTSTSFTYWIDRLFDTGTRAPSTFDTAFNLLAANGKNAPAPWVPFTRAGCDVGGVGTADLELENLAADVPPIFGANSPEAQEATNPATQAQATADFIGIAVHCAKRSDVCAAGNAK